MKNKFTMNHVPKGPKNILIMVGAFLFGIIMLTYLTDYSRQVKTMHYSSFIAAVEQGKVKSVQIAGQDVYGVLNDKDGTRFEATIVDTPRNWDLLKEHGVDIHVIPVSSSYGMWYMVFLSLLLLLPLAVWYFFRRGQGSGGSGSSIFNMGKSRARMVMPSMINVGFNSVAGSKQAKEALADIVDFLKNPEKYRRLGAKIPRGVLLVGEPGNGKTLLAKAVAGEANCPFFSITGSDFIEVFVGVGAARVRDLFAQARKHAPAIIFIDEIDAIGRSRGSGFGGGHDEREQTLNQLLTEMDGFDALNSNVIVIAATNIPEVLDKALLRPGRFDRWVTVEYPDTQTRKEILEIHTRKVRVEDAIDFEQLAQETAGFSGADLENLVNEAAISCSKKNQKKVGMQDLLDARTAILESRKKASMGSGAMLGKSSSKPKMFMPTQVKTKFDDVAGIPEAKEELQEVVDFLKNPEKYRRLGATLPSGVLLVGEPGNGKTLLAKAVAGEANCPFFSVSASDFVEMYVGVGASRVRELFAQVRKHSPSIVFIDEIDAVGGKRVAGFDGGSDERAQTLNQLLTEMDGFNSEGSTVIVMAATNRPDMLDNALLRPGRFDRRVDVPYPDIKSREQILAVHAKKIKLDTDVDLMRIARGTPGFSGADLANLVNEAALLATKHQEKQTVSMTDFEQARDKILLGKELRSVVLSPKEREMVAFHESGHTLIRLLLPDHADPLHKVTILPRGKALGVSYSLPDREKYLATKEEIFADIMVALGGRVAETIIFNVLSSGAADDFNKASHAARNMVCRYGMTDELGTVVYNQGNGQFEYSQKTAEKIDEVVHNLLKDAQQRTEKLLKDNRDKLDLLAKTLLEKETLYADEIYKLLGIEPRESFRLTDKALADA
ncbi:MAG: ATP-dependent zinc metalloprotease FtsH [Candidatus Babeliales bacterium]